MQMATFAWAPSKTPLPTCLFFTQEGMYSALPILTPQNDTSGMYNMTCLAPQGMCDCYVLGMTHDQPGKLLLLFGWRSGKKAEQIYLFGYTNKEGLMLCMGFKSFV